MSNSLVFTGSNINAGNYRGFSFYLTAEGASEVISEDVTMTSLSFPTTTGSAYLTDDVYLNIWEGDGTNAYTYLGSSTNADHCTESKTATWNFSGLALSPSKKYLVLFYSSASSSFSNTSQARIPVFAVETVENTHTIFSSAPSNPPTSTAQAWAPCMTLTFGLPHTDTNTSLKLKVMTSAQLADEEIDSSQFYVNNDTKQLLLGNKFLVGPLDGTLVNTATGTDCLTILGTPSTGTQGTNIGLYSAASSYATSLGRNARASGAASIALGRATLANKTNAVAIGVTAQATANGAIALGAQARNNEAKTFKVALTEANDNTPAVDESTGLFTLLQSNGTIPAARLAALPAEDGEYVAKLTIVSGVPTITWVKYTAVETVSELPAQSADNTVYVVTGEE